jgi:2-methylcitrate dehydratase PrpD
MTKQLAELIHSIKIERIPPAVLHKAKLCILDYIADTIAGIGSKLPSVEIILKHVVSKGAIGEATIIGTRHKVPQTEAALVNSIAGEVLELGDGENRIIGHPGQSVIPAVLAAAERRNSSGSEILAAVVAGYEAMIFVGDATMPMAYDRGFSASASLGNFGAAAGVAKILDLGVEKIGDALALAASASGFLRSWNLTGTMDKDLMVGEATRRGVLAALLAHAGYSGTSEILEGDLGFCQAMAGEYRTVKLHEPHQYRIMDVYFKPYPSCRVTHSTIDAALQLKKTHTIVPEHIQRVVIFTDSHGAQVAIPDPTSFVSVRFSNQYAAAVALLEGRIFLEQFTEDYAKRPEVKSLVAKSEVKIDPEMEGNWPDKYASRIEITTTDRQHFTAQVDYPKGDTRNPMTTEDVLIKAKDLLGVLFRESETEKIINVIMEIESLGEPEELISLLRV